MKKIITLLLASSLLATLTACCIPTAETPVNNAVKDETVVKENSFETIPDNAVQEATVAEETEGQDTITDTNYFLNETNNAYDVNSVSVKPRYVRWENGTLIAECFVINGHNTTAYNIKVKELTFSNGSGLIAAASFGDLQNLVLEPYTYALWTFTFGADCISNPNADLSSLSTTFSTSYNH